MTPIKAVVRNGRLIVDEPTTLPEGSELLLVPAEPERLALDDVEEAYAEQSISQITTRSSVISKLRK
jgi:hypothetical protein